MECVRGADSPKGGRRDAARDVSPCHARPSPFVSRSRSDSRRGPPSAAHEPVNALASSASPYLRLHAGDPVHWREWSPRLVAQARSENRLIFVSVGYFACHWCHVMQRESFSDRDAAALLNAHFIAVKVDREIDPALDAQLIRFVRATLGHAGWPLNVVLTPDGIPLFGFTYLPVGDFMRLMEQIVSRWEADPASLAAAARNVSDMLESAAPPPAAEIMDAADVRALADAFIQQASETADGTGGRIRTDSRSFRPCPSSRCSSIRSDASRSRRSKTSCA